jgi:Ribosomal protein L31e
LPTLVRDFPLQLHSINFKKRAPRAIKEIKAFAKKMMKTKVRASMRVWVATHLGRVQAVANLSYHSWQQDSRLGVSMGFGP